MKLQISKCVLVTCVFAMSLFSCSKDEAVGEVKTIGQSFEKPDTTDSSTSTSSSSDPVKQEVLVVKPGEFFIALDSANTSASFTRLFTNGENFMWSFQDGTPSTSTDAAPGVISFPGVGEYLVSLDVTIDDVDYSHSETIVFE